MRDVLAGLMPPGLTCLAAPSSTNSRTISCIVTGSHLPGSRSDIDAVVVWLVVMGGVRHQGQDALMLPLRPLNSDTMKGKKHGRY